jgi:hypothetical protein
MERINMVFKDGRSYSFTDDFKKLVETMNLLKKQGLTYCIVENEKTMFNMDRIELMFATEEVDELCESA